MEPRAQAVWSRWRSRADNRTGTLAVRGGRVPRLRSPMSPLAQRAGSAASPWDAAWKNQTWPSPAQRAHHLVIGERLLRLAMGDDLAAIAHVSPIGLQLRTHAIRFGDHPRGTPR